MSRPEVPIDWKKVETMMLAGSSGVEIAGSIGMSDDRFYIRFKKRYRQGFDAVSHRKKAGGYGNVRTRQYVSAMQGNSQMLKILGEEWLGQGKKEDVEGSEARDLILITERVKKMEAALLSRGISLADLQDEQPLLHQERGRQQDQIQYELGTEDPMGGTSCM